jgi:hemin uptake protein HemP
MQDTVSRCAHDSGRDGTRTPAAAPQAQPPGTGVLDSAQLLRGARSVTIRHNGALYRLQATRQGKLILTK